MKIVRKMAATIVATAAAAALAVTLGPATQVAALTLTVPNVKLDVLVNDAIGDPVRDVFYLTTRSDSPELPNRIVVFDTLTGDVLTSQEMSGEPGSLGISADGAVLFVGNNDAGTLEKRTLPALDLEWMVSIPKRHPSYTDVPEDIEVSPVDSDLVVASFMTPGLSPSHAGVIVATNGEVLPNTTRAHTGPNRIEFTDDPTQLVGYYNNSTGFSFWHLEIDADGVTTEASPNSVTGGFGTDIEYVDGVVVSTVGDIIDPGPPATRIGQFDERLHRRAGSFAVDAAAGLAYVTENQTAGTWDTFLSVHEISTGKRVDYLDVPEGDGLSVRESMRHIGDGSLVLIRDYETRLLFPAVVGGSFGEFTSLTPQRIVDTRKDLGRTDGFLKPGETFEMQVSGAGGVPDSDVIAAVLNVTAVNPTEQGFLTLFPTGIDLPENSNVNFPAGRTVPNLVTVRVGVDGRVSVFNAFGNVHLVVDVAGFYTGSDGPSGGRYQPVEPKRIADTRSGVGGVSATDVGPGQVLPVRVAGRAGVPSEATAVALNITTVNGTESSFLTVFPDDVNLPESSNVNFVPGRATANQAIVRLPSSGVINVYNASGMTDVIVDIMGYYEEDPARLDGRFVPLNPVRTVDTRADSPFPAPGHLFQGDILFFDPVADPVSALLVNITVTSTTGSGFVVAYPHPGEPPEVSSINYSAGQTVANHAIISTDPSYAFLNEGGRTQLIVDVFGYFT